MEEAGQKTDNKALREHVIYLLRGGGAHISLEQFLSDFPADKCNQRVENVPYTAWQILEHMRIAQWDILEFSRNAAHESPEFPKGYWPAPDERGDAKQWTATADVFRSNLEEMSALVGNAKTDLFAKIPHGDGQTILREALLVADHNAYHLGGLLVLAKAVGGKRRRQTQK